MDAVTRELLESCRTAWTTIAVALIALAVPGLAIAAGPAAGAPVPYEYYVTNHPEVVPSTARGGLMLLGGGEWPEDSMPWFAEHAGRGHIVMIGASGDQADHDELAEALGPVASLETLVLHDRASSEDPRVLGILARADGIFIHGGDQANYVRFWKGTPIARLIESRFEAGRPVGGTSAGLAILGEWSYGSLDGGSLTSIQALADPTGPAVTLVGDFLHLAPLRDVITDSHFAPRGRLGRLIVMVARLAAEGHPLQGLGIDEEAGVLVEPDGHGRVVSRNGGGVTLVGIPTESRVVPEKAFSAKGVPLRRVLVGQSLTFRPLAAAACTPHALLDVHEGDAPPVWPRIGPATGHGAPADEAGCGTR
jgi:beta-aspartyl-peptidase (threonine type)